MKKFSFIAFIAFMAVLVSTLGFAQDAPKPAGPEFKFSGEAYVYGTSIGEAYKAKGGDAVNYDYASYRFRPYFGMKSENVEATLKLEIDQYFGSQQNTDAKNGASNYADVGNDEKGNIEIKAAYLNFKIPALSGLSVKAGVDGYKTVGNFVCGTEVAGAFLNYKADMFDVTLGGAKVYENTTDKKNDDLDFAALDVSVKLGDMLKVRPALYTITGGKVSKKDSDATSFAAFAGQTAYIPSLGIDLKFDPITLAINGSYGTCSKDENDTEYSGFAFDVNPAAKFGDIKVEAFFTMVSGDNGKTETGSTQKQTNFSNFSLKTDEFGRMFLLEDKSKFSNADHSKIADARGLSYGYMLAGLSGAYKMGSFEAKAAFAWAQTAEEKDGDDKFEKGLGTEIDLTLSYEIEKNAAIVFEGGYLMFGDYYAWKKDATLATTEAENAYLVSLGMAYKW